MSGTPLSQRPASDASERTQPSTSYPTSIHQDAYPRSSAQPSPTETRPLQGYPPARDHFAPSYPRDPAQKMAHSYQQLTDFPPRPLSYPPRTLPSVSQAVPSHPYMSEAASSSGYSLPTHPSANEGQPYTSPKSQRKAKGHVASACVPCKRAHLRCDAQRPCSRCLGSGKEDACIDVQHKKRGRPRLRDDKEQRTYELSRGAGPRDATLRRPLSVYQPGEPAGPRYEPQPREIHSQPVLKPQPREPLGPRYMEHPPAREPGPYGPGLSVAAQPPEPAAYLNMNLEFSRASETFVDALGGFRNYRYLEEVVVPTERDKVLALKEQLVAEQKQREPNYLPPIFGRGDQILQGLGFGTGDVSRFNLNRQDYLTFVTAEGQPRVYPVRLGLAKEGSFFFVVLVLAIPRRAYPSTSQQEPTGQPPFYAQPPANQTTVMHPPGSMSHDLSRHRLSEGSLPPRHPSGLGPGHNPSMSTTAPTSYSAPPGRPEYLPSSSYDASRTELPSHPQSTPQPSYQLPPIRAPPEKGGSGGDRSSRVDIGVLIDRPDALGRPH